MDKQREKTIREQRQSRRALRRARAHMADPQAKLPRLLTAYAQLKSRGHLRWSLPDR